MADTKKIDEEKRYLKVPMFVEENGQIVANTLFHRSYDKLHSRCIEYPFAASKFKKEVRILDVGTAKADRYWIRWLESLGNREVYGIDFEKPPKPSSNIIYVQADVRRLPFDDNFFDKIFAVSVIEHIGLSDPQVYKGKVPEIQEAGDLEAVRELTRVLKPGGELVMTFPYGTREGLMRNGQARTYTKRAIKKFEDIIESTTLDYYEYQSFDAQSIFKEEVSIMDMFTSWLRRKPSQINLSKGSSKKISFEGAVVWRKIDIKEAQALNMDHVDGVLCGVWRK